MKNSKIEKISGVPFNNKLNSNGHKSIGKRKRSIHKLAIQLLLNTVIATVPSGIESLLSLEPKIQDLVPQEINNSQTLNVFIRKIKSQISETYQCCFYKTYI